eukprot:scaffold11275_cov108-Isochrysis_galbana.AAC.13
MCTGSVAAGPRFTAVAALGAAACTIGETKSMGHPKLSCKAVRFWRKLSPTVNPPRFPGEATPVARRCSKSIIEAATAAESGHYATKVNVRTASRRFLPSVPGLARTAVRSRRCREHAVSCSTLRAPPIKASLAVAGSLGTRYSAAISAHAVCRAASVAKARLEGIARRRRPRARTPASSPRSSASSGSPLGASARLVPSSSAASAPSVSMRPVPPALGGVVNAGGIRLPLPLSRSARLWTLGVGGRPLFSPAIAPARPPLRESPRADRPLGHRLPV